MADLGSKANIRDSYDRLSQVYFDHVGSEMEHVSVVRSGLQFFAELVGPGAKTLDAGCGPGHITDFLAAQGLSVSGVDISPALIELAKASFPHIDFGTGELAHLPVKDSSHDAIVSRHSLIHTEPERLDAVFSEFARVLVPKGRLFLSFFATDTADDHGRPFDHQVCTAYQLDASIVAGLLASHGLAEEVRIVRQPRAQERQMPHAILYARAAAATQ